MTVATFVQPNYLTQSASAYKAAIDAAISVLNSIGGDFAPHASTAPNMQVVIDAGRIFKPGGTIVSIAQQTTGALIAPVSNSRIDRIVVDSEDGVYSVLTGTESASPVAPAIPNGKLPVCQISMTVGMTVIANSIITDERTTYGPLAKLLRMPVEAVVAATSGFTREILLIDRGILFDCDCSNGPIELLLPDSAQAGNGFMIGLIKSDSTENRVTLTPSTTGETFNDGTLTKQVSVQNGTVILATDGLGQWYLAFDSSRTYNNVALTGSTTAENLSISGTATAPTAGIDTETTLISTTAFSIAQDERIVTRLALSNNHVLTPAVSKNINLNAVTYKTDTVQLVMVGNADGTDAYILYGTALNGISLTEATNPKNFNLHDVAVSSGTYIAVGNADGTDAYIITSSNASSWTERANPKNFNLTCVDANLAVAVAGGFPDGTDAYLVRSADSGATWSEITNANNGTISDIFYSSYHNAWIAVGGTNLAATYILRSTDNGVSFSQISTPNINSLGIICEVPGNHHLLALADGILTNQFLKSVDGGLTWTSEVLPTAQVLYNSVSLPNGVLLLSDYSCFYTEEGVRFYTVPNSESLSPRGGAFASSAGNYSVYMVGPADGTNPRILRTLSIPPKYGVI